MEPISCSLGWLQACAGAAAAALTGARGLGWGWNPQGLADGLAPAGQGSGAHGGYGFGLLPARY